MAAVLTWTHDGTVTLSTPIASYTGPLDPQLFAVFLGTLAVHSRSAPVPAEIRRIHILRVDADDYLIRGLLTQGRISESRSLEGIIHYIAWLHSKRILHKSSHVPSKPMPVTRSARAKNVPATSRGTKKRLDEQVREQATSRKAAKKAPVVVVEEESDDEADDESFVANSDSGDFAGDTSVSDDGGGSITDDSDDIPIAFLPGVRRGDNGDISSDSDDEAEVSDISDDDCSDVSDDSSAGSFIVEDDDDDVDPRAVRYLARMRQSRESSKSAFAAYLDYVLNHRPVPDHDVSAVTFRNRARDLGEAIVRSCNWRQEIVTLIRSNPTLRHTRDGYSGLCDVCRHERFVNDMIQLGSKKFLCGTTCVKRVIAYHQLVHLDEGLRKLCGSDMPNRAVQKECHDYYRATIAAVLPFASGERDRYDD